MFSVRVENNVVPDQMASLHSRPPEKSAYLKIILLISQPKHMLWVLKKNVSMFKLMGKGINAILGAKTILIWTYGIVFLKKDKSWFSRTRV